MKLTNLKPRMGSIGPRLISAPRQMQEQRRLVAREQTTDWRSWYKTARWQRLRETILIRDAFTCQKTGIMLLGKHPAPDSPTVHHRHAHRGDPALFWDPDNLESVAKSWHDSVAQALEHADKVAAIHPKWLQPSLVPLTIVCGPPASGKTTYAKDNAGPFDLIIDLDIIASEISGEPVHGWNRDAWLNAALYRRNDLLGSLSRPSRYPAAWLIVSEPKAKHRDWWQQTLKPKAIVVIETSEPQCVANAAKDEGRDQKRTADGIVRWWFDYDRRPGETVIRQAPIPE
jgi:hypothetical protein